MALDMTKADHKDATLSLRLKADSGYRSDSDGYRVSPNQWSRIIAICEDAEQGRVLAAAPDLLKAAQKLIRAADEGDADLGMDAHDELRAAIARAKEPHP